MIRLALVGKALNGGEWAKFSVRHHFLAIIAIMRGPLRCRPATAPAASCPGLQVCRGREGDAWCGVRGK